MGDKEWPKLGDIILVQERPMTDAQRELWKNRQPPTRKGEVVEVPRLNGDGFLTIDVGGEYGGVTYAARDFGTRYTWKSTGERAEWAREALAAADTKGPLAELVKQLKALPPEQKIEVFQALGMTRIGDDHDTDCLARNTSGIRCNCVPPASTWTHPEDVEAFLKEAWEDRLALARKRS